MIIKYCVNCEEQISELHHNTSDFCSDTCASEYATSADTNILEQVSKQNPDIVPSSDINLSGISNNRSYNKTGILPPNSIEAISSLLQTSDSGKLKHAIDNAVKNNQPDDSKPE